MKFQNSSPFVTTQELRGFVRSEILALFYDYFKDQPKLDLEIQIDECFKFLYLASSFEVFSGSFIPVTKEIDEVWHYLIIQTRDYSDFCQRLPGKKFIHHKSIHFDQFSAPKSREEIMSTFLRWIAHYVYAFGPFSVRAADYWVIVKFMKTYFHYSLEDIHNIAFGILAKEGPIDAYNL